MPHAQPTEVGNSPVNQVISAKDPHNFNVTLNYILVKRHRKRHCRNLSLIEKRLNHVFLNLLLGIIIALPVNPAFPKKMPPEPNHLNLPS